MIPKIPMILFQERILGVGFFSPRRLRAGVEWDCLWKSGSWDLGDHWDKNSEQELAGWA